MKLLRKLAVVIVALGSVSIVQADVIHISYQSFSPSSSFVPPPGGSTALPDIQLEATFIIDTDPRIDFASAGSGIPASAGSSFSGLINGIPIETNNIEIGATFLGGINFTALFETVLFGYEFGRITLFTNAFPSADGGIPPSLTVSDLGNTGSDIIFLTPGQTRSVRFPENIQIRSIPEPGTLALFGIGLFGMGLSRRRRKV